MERREEERPGMRLIEIWVPDLNDPKVAEEFRRQLELVREYESQLSSNQTAFLTVLE